MASFGGAWTQTQEDYGSSGGGLAKQLGAGIRAIDIRARIQSDNTLVIHHGSSYQNRPHAVWIAPDFDETPPEFKDYT